MKKYCLLLLFIIFTVFSSCSDTRVIFLDSEINESVDAPAVSGQFTKRALIEDFTGTWCGNCTRVSYGIEKVFEQTERVVAVAVHNGNDPYHFDGIEPLRAMIYPEFPEFPLPTVRLNRTITWTFPEVSNIQQVKNLTSNNCGLGLALNSTVANGTVDLDVKVKFAQNYSNLRVIVYLLESHLIYEQRNYTDFYGPENTPTYPNFEHNHVLRASLTNILGNALSDTTFGKTSTTSFSLPVPSDVANSEHISFVAFVVDENNTVINVREAEANTTQTFEENP